MNQIGFILNKKLGSLIFDVQHRKIISIVNKRLTFCTQSCDAYTYVAVATSAKCKELTDNLTRTPANL